MSALVIASTEPTSLVAVNDQCSSVELWAEQCESIPELQDANNKLAAINEYLERTSAEGCARVTAARRRLEMRIGKLLGPPERNRPGTPRTESFANDSVNKQSRSKFRQMADNEDEVERVIAESTDQQPASRRKVMRAVRGETLPTQRVDRSPQAVKEREGLDEHKRHKREHKDTQALIANMAINPTISSISAGHGLDHNVPIYIDIYIPTTLYY